MNKDQALKVAGVVFLVVGLLQGTRWVLKVPVMAGGWAVPVGLSVVAALVLLGLAYYMFRAAKG